MRKWVGNKGFTIVELLIVIVVIAILAAIVVVAYNGITNNSRQSAIKQSLATVSKKIQTFGVDNNGAVPASLGDIGIVNDASVTYQYMGNTAFTPNTYCLTASSGTYTFHIATNGEQTEGPCPMHTGTQVANLSCPTGFITVPGNSLFQTKAFCAMKYEAKQSGSAAVSVPAGLPWISLNQGQAQNASAASCVGCQLMTLNQWLTIANNVAVVPSNWTSGVVGSGLLMRGNSDGTPSNTLPASTDNDGYNGTGNSASVDAHQRRTMTLTNGEVIWDFSGNAWELLADATPAVVGAQPGQPGETVNNFVYKAWDAPGMQKGQYPQVFPGYGNAQAANENWGSGQGMGRPITSTAQADSRVFIMGGAYTTGGQNTGAFTLRLNYTSDQASTSVSFRAVYAP